VVAAQAPASREKDHEEDDCAGLDWVPWLRESAEALEAETVAYAMTLAGNAPLSIRASKLTINEMLKDESRRNMDAIREIGERCFNSADYKEGRTAFMEKRQPVFTGR